jgi:hypothetical protein
MQDAEPPEGEPGLVRWHHQLALVQGTIMTATLQHHALLANTMNATR